MSENKPSGPEPTNAPVQLWRVDVSGVSISVRGEVAYRHLQEVNRRMARMELALHHLCKMHPDADTMNVARDGLYQ